MTERVDWAAMLAWLSERVDTDEQVANEATVFSWHRVPEDEAEFDGEGRVETVDGQIVIWDHGCQLSKHIGRHDPKRVLAEVSAKRAMLADWQQTREKWAAIYDRPDAGLHADRMHPDYEYATTEGQRKAWNHSDEPPWGDGGPDHTWERNVDAGRDGWERFDYTEESYWRRLLPDQRGRGEPEPPRHVRQLVTAYQHEAGYRPEWAPEVPDGQ